MPRDGSLTLSDVREPTLSIGCEPPGRHGRYNIARLIAAHGADAKLTELLMTLANCEKARSRPLPACLHARMPTPPHVPTVC